METRSKTTDAEVYKWKYIGGNGSQPVSCTAKAGDVLQDDMDIILPNKKIKKDRLFFLKEVKNGHVVGYFMHQGLRIGHKRTFGHINTFVPPTAQPTKHPRRSSRTPKPVSKVVKETVKKKKKR